MWKSCMLYFMSNYRSTSSFCPSCSHDVTMEHSALHPSHLSHFSDPSLLSSSTHSTVCTCLGKILGQKGTYYTLQSSLQPTSFLTEISTLKTDGQWPPALVSKEKEHAVCPWEEPTIMDSGMASSFSNLASSEESRLLKKWDWLKEVVLCMK